MLIKKEKWFSGKVFNIRIKENKQGIIIDVWDKKEEELIDTFTIWNDLDRR